MSYSTIEGHVTLFGRYPVHHHRHDEAELVGQITLRHDDNAVGGWERLGRDWWHTDAP